MKHFRWFIIAALTLASAASGAQIDLELEPDDEALRRNIEVHIGTVEDRSAAELRRMSSYIREQARLALHALGYYQAEIRTELVENTDDSGDAAPRLRLEIDAGEPVRFSEVKVRIEGPGEDSPAFQIPDERIPDAGQQLNHGAYESLKGFIQGQAQRYGFFDGQFSSQKLIIDPEAGTAVVDLIYQTGPRFTLGEVTFTGDTPFDPELLHRFVQFEPGTPYHSDLVAQLNQDLRSSNYFDEILVNASPERAVGTRIPVTVELGEREPHSLGVGLGYSTDVGPRAKLNWTQHWLNAAGHSRGAEMEIAAPRQSLGAWYEIPLDPPMTDSLRLTSGYLREDIEDVETRQITVGGQWLHETESGWQRVVSLELLDERFTVGEQKGHSTLLLPGLSLDRLVSDSPTDPNEGYRLRLASKFAHRSLLSDADLAQVILGAKGLTTLAGNHRFLAGVRVGAIATNDFSAVPPSLRFFAGGSQSIRGYGYRSLGPTDDNGDNVGGRYLLESTLEYQYSLTEQWRLATFVDHGNAVNSLDAPLKTGVGVGVRWVSPVGPLRLDIAQALDDGGWRIHFSMGPEL